MFEMRNIPFFLNRRGHWRHHKSSAISGNMVLATTPTTKDTETFIFDFVLNTSNTYLTYNR
jgi:hypothetical protein